jgi:hypothetical protein
MTHSEIFQGNRDRKGEKVKPPDILAWNSEIITQRMVMTDTDGNVVRCRDQNDANLGEINDRKVVAHWSHMYSTNLRKDHPLPPERTRK